MSILLEMIIAVQWIALFAMTPIVPMQMLQSLIHDRNYRVCSFDLVYAILLTSLLRNCSII